MEIQDKVIVITGGTKGLGYELAKSALKEGAKVIISGRESVSTEIVAKELGVIGISADISDEAQVKKLAEEALENFGRIDIWINNAGIWFPWAELEKTDVSNLRQMLEVNLLGTIFGSRQAAVYMKKQKSGVIVNIISTTGLNGRAGSSGYAASKSGVIGFSKSIRKELAPLGIRVSSIYPGGMKTEIFGKDRIPGYENFMDPHEVAKAIIRNLEKDNPEEELVLEYSKDLQKV